MVWFVRSVCAGVLLTAASMKTFELVNNPTLGRLYGSKWLEAGLIEYEVLLVCWLLSGICARWCRWILLATFFCFGCYAAYAALSGAGSCGCFGPVQVSPWWTLGLDGIVLFALLRWRPTAAHTTFGRLMTACTIAASFSLLVAGSLWARPALAVAQGFFVDDSMVLLQPEEWVGSRFLLADHVGAGERLMKGRWTVLLYHHDCPKCQEVLPQYNSAAATDPGNQVMLIEVPPFGERAPLGGTKVEQLRDDITWFVTTPVEISLVDGRVTSVISEGTRRSSESN